MALVALLLLVGEPLLIPPPLRVVVLAEPAPEPTPPAPPLVELLVEDEVALTGRKFAQAMRVLFAKWRTMERLPMKLPRPGWRETYASV